MQTAKRSATEQHRAATFKGRVRLPVQLLHERRAVDALRAVHLLPALPRVQSRGRTGVSSSAWGRCPCRHQQSSAGHVAHRCSDTKAEINVLTSMVSSNAVSHWPKPPRCSDVMLHTSEAAGEVQQHDPRCVVHGPLQIVHVSHSCCNRSQTLFSTDTGELLIQWSGCVCEWRQSPEHLLRSWREAEEHISVKVRAIRTALLRLGKAQRLILRISGHACTVMWRSCAKSCAGLLRNCYRWPQMLASHQITYLNIPVMRSDIVGEAAGLQRDDLPHVARCACMQVTRRCCIA
jgi:hypothetical protein